MLHERTSESTLGQSPTATWSDGKKTKRTRGRGRAHVNFSIVAADKRVVVGRRTGERDSRRATFLCSFFFFFCKNRCRAYVRVCEICTVQKKNIIFIVINIIIIVFIFMRSHRERFTFARRRSYCESGVFHSRGNTLRPLFWNSNGVRRTTLFWYTNDGMRYSQDLVFWRDNDEQNTPSTSRNNKRAFVLHRFIKPVARRSDLLHFFFHCVSNDFTYFMYNLVHCSGSTSGVKNCRRYGGVCSSVCPFAHKTSVWILITCRQMSRCQMSVLCLEPIVYMYN